MDEWNCYNCRTTCTYHVIKETKSLLWFISLLFNRSYRYSSFFAFIRFCIFIWLTKSNTTSHSSHCNCYTGYFSSPAKGSFIITSCTTWSACLRCNSILWCLSRKSLRHLWSAGITNKSWRINEHILDLWWGSEWTCEWILCCRFGLSN